MRLPALLLLCASLASAQEVLTVIVARYDDGPVTVMDDAGNVTTNEPTARWVWSSPWQHGQLQSSLTTATTVSSADISGAISNATVGLWWTALRRQVAVKVVLP